MPIVIPKCTLAKHVLHSAIIVSAYVPYLVLSLTAEVAWVFKYFIRNCKGTRSNYSPDKSSLRLRMHFNALLLTQDKKKYVD